MIDNLRGALRFGLAETAGVVLILLLLWEVAGRAFNVFGMIGLAVAIVISANLFYFVREPEDAVARSGFLDEPVLRRPFARFLALRELVRGTAVEGDQFEVVLHPLIVEIADFRLAQRYGVDRARQPERARAILGEHLWGFVSEPPAAAGSAAAGSAAMEGLLGELEAL